MRRTPRLGAALLLTLALAGCSALGPAGAQPGTAQPGAAQPVTDQPSTPGDVAPAGPSLVAEGVVFDPVAHDVDPDAECEGLPGRDTWEVFDRVAWPDLGVAAGDALLTCGNVSGSGWRHIADGHTGDFGELADLVDASWEDVAVFAIDRALEQPTRVVPYRDDIADYEVLVEYVDDGRTLRSWMVTVGVGFPSGRVITSFPDEQY